MGESMEDIEEKINEKKKLGEGFEEERMKEIGKDINV